MDVETQMLAALSQEIERDYSSDTNKLWVGSPFAWIRGRASRQRGAIGEQLVAGWFCLGLSPFQAHCWILPKSILLQYVIGIMGQHTGAQGQETAWLSVNPAQPLSWLKDYGGTLADAWQVFQRMIHERETQVSQGLEASAL